MSHSAPSPGLTRAKGASPAPLPDCALGATLVVAGLLLGLTAVPSWAQTNVRTDDGVTPFEMAPGRPAGTYPLSDFDAIHPFSGRVNVSIPLLRVGGRGEAAADLVARIDRSWRFELVSADPAIHPSKPDFKAISEPWNKDWELPRYAPGFMLARPAVQQRSLCRPPQIPDIGVSAFAGTVLMRLNFVAADGTEIEFRARGRKPGEPWGPLGAPLAPGGTCPGLSGEVQVEWDREWVSADGSNATFHADQVLSQTVSSVAHAVSGTLYLRNGLRYRIDDGRVTSIVDRNGNTVTFNFDAGAQQLTITDSIGRQTLVRYNRPCQTGVATACDTINYKGAGGIDRVIEIGYSYLRDRLRRDHPITTATIYDLFPDLGVLTSSKGGPRLNNNDTFNPAGMLAWIQLPQDGAPGNASLRYDFYYNYWGEIAAVRLPTEHNGLRENGKIVVEQGTGGWIEYDWSGRGETTVASGREIAVVARRVAVRRVLAGPSTNPSVPITKAITYFGTPVPENGPGGIPGSRVEVRRCIIRDGTIDAGTPPDLLGSLEKHFYFGLRHQITQLEPTDYIRFQYGREWQTEIWDGESKPCTSIAGSSTLLKRIESVWAQRPDAGGEWRPNPDAPAWDVRLASQTVTVGSLSATTSYGHDRYNNVVQETAMDYGNTALLRSVTRTFAQDTASIEAGHLRSLLTSETIAGPAGTEASSTYVYDQFPLEAAPEAIGYTNPGGAARGNLTTHIQLGLPDVNETRTTETRYDILGNVRLSTLAQGTADEATTSYGYTDRYVAGHPHPRRCDPQVSGANTYAFATRITRPYNRVSHVSFDRHWGRAVRLVRPSGRVDIANALSFVDDQNPNNVMYDPLDRLNAVQLGCGLDEVAEKPQLLGFYYDDFQRMVRSRRQQTPEVGSGSGEGATIWQEMVYHDVLGLEYKRILSESCATGGLGCGKILVETLWDGMGRKSAVTNPTREEDRGSGFPPYTRSYYDGLGRVTVTDVPDSLPGLSRSWTSSVANTVTTTDPQGHVRRTTLDALGRTTKVEEYPDGGPALATSYTYDGRGNLVRVAQGIQVRTFVYDGFGQLRQATNPESGITDYRYDLRGNLRLILKRVHQEASPAVRVDMAYDKLDRLLSKTYTPATTPAVTYGYDEGVEVNRWNHGRLTSVTSGGTVTAYGYDSLGHLKSSSQTTAGTTYSFSYDFDRLGNLTSVVYPSGRTIRAKHDNLGRLHEVLMGGIEVAKAGYGASVYSPNGILKSMTLGNGTKYQADVHWHSQLTTGIRLRAANDSLLAGFDYLYGDTSPPPGGPRGNDGNVYYARTNVPTAAGLKTFTQMYQYDGADRLLQSVETFSDWALNQYSSVQVNRYDRYGNRWVIEQQGTPPSPTRPTSQAFFNPANNRLTNSNYDALGNNLRGPNTPETVSLVYDAEGRVTGTTDGAVAYEYDGEGRRVKQVVNGNTTVFVYDGLGRLAAEYGGGGGSPGLNYVTTDLLGSIRLVTNEAGQVVSRHDFLPFGEELTGAPRSSLGAQYGEAMGIRHRFTGKERDVATGLDYFGARYFSSQQGRFMSPDPVFNLKPTIMDPQRWNRYAYVSNNPLSFVDPNGEEEVFIFDPSTRPPDQGAGTGYQGRVWVKRNDGSVAGPFRGSSYPNSADYQPGKGYTPYTGNQLAAGTHKFNNRSGHDRSRQKGLNLVDPAGARVSPGTNASGAPVTMSYVNVHEGTSDLGQPTSRGSRGCVTIAPEHAEQFFLEFDWSTSSTTGMSEGEIHVVRDDNVDATELNLELAADTQRAIAAAMQHRF